MPQQSKLAFKNMALVNTEAEPDQISGDALKGEDGDRDITMGNEDVKSEPKSSPPSMPVKAGATVNSQGQDKKSELANGKETEPLRLPRDVEH